MDGNGFVCLNDFRLHQMWCNQQWVLSVVNAYVLYKYELPYTIHSIIAIAMQTNIKKATKEGVINILSWKDKWSNHIQVELSLTPLGRIQEWKKENQCFNLIAKQTLFHITIIV